MVIFYVLIINNNNKKNMDGFAWSMGQYREKKNGNILCTERKGVVDGWQIVSSGWEYAENHNKSKTHALFTTLSLKEEK